MVIGFYSLQCFDTDGSVAGRTSGQLNNPVQLILRGSFPKQVVEEDLMGTD